MDDKELLGLAARAAGIRIDKSPFGGGGANNTGFDMLGNAVLNWHNNVIWNPLTDDGDALRLAVKLKLLIDTDDCCAMPMSKSGAEPGDWSDGMPDDNPCAATRRAIVRAAAQIGKVMRG